MAIGSTMSAAIMLMINGSFGDRGSRGSSRTSLRGDAELLLKFDASAWA